MQLCCPEWIKVKLYWCNQHCTKCFLETQNINQWQKRPGDLHNFTFLHLWLSGSQQNYIDATNTIQNVILETRQTDERRHLENCTTLPTYIHDCFKTKLHWRKQHYTKRYPTDKRQTDERRDLETCTTLPIYICDWFKAKLYWCKQHCTECYLETRETNRWQKRPGNLHISVVVFI